MKNILKITCITLAACWMGSCTNNFEEYNTDPYAIYNATPEQLLKRMIEAQMYVQQNTSQMVEQMVGAQGGYFALSNRWGGANFDTFNASDDWNASLYKDVSQDIFPNMFKIEKSTRKSGHFYAMARMLRATGMMRVTDCYGPIPYSKVADGQFYVAYDKGEDVYKAMLEDLSAAASVLHDYSLEYPASRPLGGNDQIYAGDYASWARFANSMRLRMAIRTNDRAAAEQACTHPAGFIVSNEQNAMRDPGVQGNPYQLAAASWGDLRVNSSIVDYMLGYNDPRTSSYFLKSTFDATRYIGLRAGSAEFSKNDVQGYSQPKFAVNSKLPLFVAAETSFLLAEAALRGWNVAGTAQSHYENGVRLSLGQHGVAAADIALYLADQTLTPGKHLNDPRGTKFNYDRKSTVKIMWSDADAFEVNLERIITQKWIANYPNGLEAWAEFRRTGYPELTPALDNLNPGVITDNFRGMRRLRYPFTERNLNRTNYDQAVVALGGLDNESVDLFWTKKK